MTDTPAGSNVLFISHNAADRPFAVALQQAIWELVDSKTLIDVRFSTSDESGPQGGEKWRNWIYRQVVEARTALIVVTPNAIGKPWLLWEAGACLGAALAGKAMSVPAASGEVAGESDSLGGRLIVSIAYGLTENECPDPLRGDQIILGANAERMEQQFNRILDAHHMPNSVQRGAGKRMPAVLDRYLATVRTAMLQAPSLVTEANVQDWLSRLDALVRSDRLSELGGFQRWMMLAFGRDADAAGVPIDVRLHRRLGELYLGQKQFALAVEQLTLARRAAPRDIYVLRPLVEAAMKRLEPDRVGDDTATREQIESLLAAIQELDDRAFVSTPDAAALYGNYLRRVRGDREGAARVYEQALQANASSYYLADLLAQTLLELGRLDEAGDTYQRALGIIDHLGEQNVWSHATAAAACLALGDCDGARRRLAAIAALGTQVNDNTLRSVREGLDNVAARIGIASATRDELLSAIRGPS